MRSPLLTRTLALAGAVLASPLAGAVAQDNPLGLTVVALEGPGGSRTTAEGINRGFSTLDCAGADSALARVAPMAGTNITTDIVDIWLVTDDTDCSTVEARNPDMGTCRHLGSADVDATDSSFDVPLSAIDTAASTAICDTTTRAGVNVRLFALATGNVEDRGDVGDAWGKVTVLVDPLGPAAAELDETSVFGDNEVTLSWSRVSDDNATYRIYSGGPCGGGGGGDGAVDADGGTPSGLTLIKETSTGASSTTINPESIGLAAGESIEVFVVAVDEADNEGDPAGPICVTRQDVAGFCDVFMEEGGECDPDGCSAGGSMAARGSLALPFLLAFFLFRRRR